MLIDDNLVSIDGEALKGMTGRAVPLTSLFKPGKHHDPIPMSVKVLDEPAGGTSITMKLQQSDDEAGVFADVPGSELTVALADMIPGQNIGWRYLPSGVTQQWVKVVVTAAGTFTTGRLFAAIVREEEMPMSEGLYIDAGVTQG